MVIIIDTSSSLEKRLGLIKRKLNQLLKEQILNKTSFNLIQFSSTVSSWRDHLAPANNQNLLAAKEWINGLTTSGSTDTLSALRKAMSIDGIEAIYLLTDGR